MQRQLLYKYIICIPVKTLFYMHPWPARHTATLVQPLVWVWGQTIGLFNQWNKFENSLWPHMNMHISLLYSIHKTVGEKHLNDDLLLAILKYTTKKWTVYYKCSTGMSRLHHSICIHTIQSFVDRHKVISYLKSKEYAILDAVLIFAFAPSVINIALQL